MKSNNLIQPNFLFEVSWEVCNKVGGIHTVIATKVASLSKILNGTHILIGPDVQEENNPEFIEDPKLLHAWQVKAEREGLKVRVGRWNIKEKPIVILVDFSAFFAQKDKILKELWDVYQLDSLSGQWDYIEPALFGYATGKVIDSYVQTYCQPTDHIVAQFHEWMTGTGLLYLKAENPQVACAFTTHATALGRCIAGNSLPLYDQLKTYDPDEIAGRFNITAKQSLEKLSAIHADTFTTVSDITANECKQFFGKKVDLVTPNGFQDFIGKRKDFGTVQSEGRKKLIDVAEGILARSISDKALLIGTSGRYEFKNKGIDVFIDALGKLNKDKSLKREIVAFILVPAGHEGPSQHLLSNLREKEKATPLANPYLSHTLTDEYNDPSINAIRRNELYNREEDKVKIFFIPSYLNGNDGVFNVPYYDLLAGLDLSLFPSYYEPWGYTPLESVAFKVPTITTTLAGFGLWIKTYYKGDTSGVTVIDRNDNNDGEVIDTIVKNILRHAEYTSAQAKKAKESAYEVSKIALWDNLTPYYIEAYSGALKKVEKRYKPAKQTKAKFKYTGEMENKTEPNWHNIIVHRNVPEKFKALEELARNLWWCWNQDAIELFSSIDLATWDKLENNPISFLNTISLSRYKELEKDKKYMKKLSNVYAQFKDYMSKKATMKGPKIAYYCMEYGLHTSLKIYSGGLGILAGDYMKEASDKAIPMVGVGFLYRYGYFKQKLSSFGNQENIYNYQLFDTLPVTPQQDRDGNWLTVHVDFPGRRVSARVWRVDVGRTELYLFDTDHEENLPEDRSITHHLYGGDWENRLKQELLLGIGGIKLIEKLNYQPDVFHMNEGHAAFIGLERINQLVNRDNLSFAEAVEVVRSSSLFTTHTPVPAGHDAFEEGLLCKYLYNYAERLHTDWEHLVGLGRVNGWDSNEKFSMSNLAIHLSQEVNGVSWLHGKVSQEMFTNLFPGYLANEVPIGYVTNGVHYPTWAAPEWKTLLAEQLGASLPELEYSRESFEKIQTIDDNKVWEVRNKLRAHLIEHIKELLADHTGLRYYSPREIVEIHDKLDPNILTIGFARRFATYKRADLLFRNLDTLNRIVNNPERPVQFIFAGKAHPADIAGQDLIKRIVEISKYPQFLGKIIFIENYDMTLSSKMVQGVDVWLNTPTRPLEASGTSGEKAAMNGVMHFSVLDGWWVEGYKEGAGWMLPLEQVYENNDYQNELDAETVYNVIETEIAPMFYNKTEKKAPADWIRCVKNTIDQVASNFTTRRMLQDYEDRYYSSLTKRHKQVVQKDFAVAKEIVSWRENLCKEWERVEALSVESYDSTPDTIISGQENTLKVTISCGALSPDDIGVELLFAHKQANGDKEEISNIEKLELKCISREGSIATYQLIHTPDMPGTYSSGMRIYAKNKLLAHQTDSKMVRWL